MKTTLRVLVLAILFSINLLAQDTLFIYQNNTIVWKESIERIDSVVLRNYDAAPELQYFGFTKAHNSFLLNDIVCSIDNNQIAANMLLQNKNLIAEFYTHPDNIVEVNGVQQVSGITMNNFSEDVNYTVTNKIGLTKEYTVSLNWMNGLPEIAIKTVNNEPVIEKKQYIRGYVELDGKGFYPNFADSMEIRGRGNSTWGMPKKPYRFKLDDNASLLGMHPAKNWVLLAEYFDPTFLKNAVALKIGRLLNLPFTNNTVSVAVTFNNQFIGIYTFTEHKEVKENRIDIHKTDAVLYELDVYYDEDYKFYSSGYNLPVMFQSPDFEKLDEPERTEKFDLFKSYFEEMEDALLDENFPNNNYRDLIDIETVVDYILVYDLTFNREINHPKSTYLHKDIGGKIRMGPIWDFDWGFGYDYPDQHFENYDANLFSTSQDALGAVFFKRFFDDPEVKTMYKNRWESFRDEHIDSILDYIDIHAANINAYQVLDNEVWHNGVSDYMNFIEEFKEWILKRVDYMDDKVKNW